MLDEALAGRIAERAAVGALTGVGAKVAEAAAKEAVEGVHESPITPRGERILVTPVACWDFRGTRSYVLTKAWALMEARHLSSLPVHEAWGQVRKVCYLDESEIPEKRRLMEEEAERLKVPVAVGV